ncbi:MAG: thiamine pyrophosphate-dependent enzyme [Gammaproteobacteria bacterium]
MAERSFSKEVQKLKLGDDEVFHGEGILAVTKALLQSGVAYVGGYQGAPVSHLMDVFSDAGEILEDLGVQFESSANEAAAASMLAASINYPLRGAVTWKAPVGTNVASDALSNIASAGVKGGVLIILGEDYGEGASVIQERSHAHAMKSQLWLLDPRPNLPMITRMVEKGFELSEASHTPVMLELRIRACHVYGQFVAKRNRKPAFTIRDALDDPKRNPDRINLPPFIYQLEKEKVHERRSAAVDFIKKERLNEIIDGRCGDAGIIVQGGIYNTGNRALELLGCSDTFGNSEIPIYVLNVTYPLIDDELIKFCSGKRAILIIEEGQPDFIEQAVNSILRKADIQAQVSGKDVLPMAGEYTAAVVRDGIEKFLQKWCPNILNPGKTGPSPTGLIKPQPGDTPQVRLEELRKALPQRPPGLCTGCPERPFFTAMKLLEKETGKLQVSADIGCHTFATLEPFNMGSTVTGYGLGASSASAFNIPHKKRALSLMGDGGFWHNGLNSGITNAVENEHDGVIIIIDNGYAAATGGQWTPSSNAQARNRQYKISIKEAVKGVGVKWVRTVRTYDISQSLETLREAMATHVKGPKVIIAEGECQLNRQRRIKPVLDGWLKQGKRFVRERFGVDADTCTGDHSCIRLSGCPSLTIKENPDPLRCDPVAHVTNSCVGCGVCGEVAHAAVLCPSFYRADTILNPNLWDKILSTIRHAFISFLQRRIDRKLMKYQF